MAAALQTYSDIFPRRIYRDRNQWTTINRCLVIDVIINYESEQLITIATRCPTVLRHVTDVRPIAVRRHASATHRVTGATCVVVHNC